MRSKLLVGMVLAMAVFSLAGCGVKDKKEMKKEIKTDKVSVSGNSGMTPQERKEALFKAGLEECGMTLSKNCLYSSNEDSPNDDYITQWNRKGEKVSSTRKDGYEVNGCSDKRLICSVDIVGKDEIEIYSIPLKQTESGECVQWDKEEKVASSDDADPYVFLCEPYLVYCENENTLTRLNLETKEKKTMQFDMSCAWFNNSYIMDGLLYLVEEKTHVERVYCIRIDDWTSEKLYENKTEGEIYNICIDGRSLYVLISAGASTNAKIICYDMEKRKVVGQQLSSEIDTLLQKEGVTESAVTKYIDGIWENLFVYEGRLYLSLDDLEIKSKTGEEYGRWVLLSCSTEGMTDLKYEREISEWWCENSAAYGDEGYIERYDFGFWLANEDVFYFVYADKQKEKEHLMRYHLDTKKWEEVPENELVSRAVMDTGFLEE